MDLLDFDGEDMYFDEPVGPDVEKLLAEAARRYGEDAAELSLLRAYFLEPAHLTVLVALYRFYYYQRRYREALITAERAIALCAERLALPASWQTLTEADLASAAERSMSLTRFLLLALKGAGYLLMRLGEHAAALERLEKLAQLDTSERLGLKELLAMARTAAHTDPGETVRLFPR